MTAPVILVTGASRGLGRGVALELAKNGYSVAINYAGNKAAADECAQMCKDLAISDEQKFVPVQCDISDGAAQERMLAEIDEAFGRLDGLVNNAGIAPRVRADMLEASEESFNELLATNTRGPYFLTQRVAKRWVEAKGKGEESLLPEGYKVVFVTSISAHTMSVNRGDYCISKAAVSMGAALWAARLADEGVQVYEIRPGIMKTDMTAGVTGKYDALIEEGLVPQKRWGTGEDVGKAARSLIAGDFPFSTGTIIDIDGGFQMRRL